MKDETFRIHHDDDAEAVIEKVNEALEGTGIAFRTDEERYEGFQPYKLIGQEARAISECKYPNIASISEVTVLFDSGDGGGFGNIQLVTVVTTNGTVYMWPRNGTLDGTLDWINREHSS